MSDMNYIVDIFQPARSTARIGLSCILHLDSESVMIRGRNKIML
jgi:hypothetical protein